MGDAETRVFRELARAQGVHMAKIAALEAHVEVLLDDAFPLARKGLSSDTPLPKDTFTLSALLWTVVILGAGFVSWCAITARFGG